MDGDAVPEAFVCPITREQMVDPVVALDGHSYSRLAVQDWFREGSARRAQTSCSRVFPPTSQSLRSCWARAAIGASRARCKHCFCKNNKRRINQKRTQDTAGGGQDTVRDDTRSAVFHGRVQEAHARRPALSRRLPSLWPLRNAVGAVAGQAVHRDEALRKIARVRHCSDRRHRPRRSNGVPIMMMMIFYCSFRNKIQNADSLSRTLQKLHESWLVLRDIKPPNILLDR
jgi:hypothetical protein